MKFKDKLKKDKGFRFKVVIIAALIILFYGSFLSPEKKEWHGPDQSVCNVANTVSGAQCKVGIAGDTWYFPTNIRELYIGDSCMNLKSLGGGPVQEDVDMCISLEKGGEECKVATRPNSQNYDGFACFGCVPVGLRASSEDDCCSRDARFSEYGDDGYDYLCKDIDPENPPENKICNSFEQGIADMMEGVGIKLQCKTAYFLFIIGMAFMALILLAAML